jgi:hypothetical protein
MTLIRIGQLTLNLDNATSIRDLSTKDASGADVPGPIRLNFAGGEEVVVLDQAPALRGWLAGHSQDVGG